MIRSIAFALPEGWHDVPADADDAWAQGLAEELVAGVSPTASAGGYDTWISRDPKVAAASLRQDFGRVAAALRPVRQGGALGALLVRHPLSGLADAMVAVTVHQHAALATYERELEAMVDEELGRGAVQAQAFALDVPAGAGRGAHLVTIEDDAPSASVAGVTDGFLPVLRERVVLSVFPEGTPGMVEVVVLPDSMSSFADAVAETAGLCAGLRVVVGEEAA